MSVSFIKSPWGGSAAPRGRAGGSAEGTLLSGIPCPGASPGGPRPPSRQPVPWAPQQGFRGRPDLLQGEEPQRPWPLFPLRLHERERVT